MTPVEDNLAKVRKRMTRAARKAGREPEDVKLLAVSKSFGPDLVEQAAKGGQEHFGENYLQEAIGKIRALPALSWHFIGTIQSNKTRQIAARFDWVHTLSSGKIARRLHEAREEGRGPINAFLQINISREEGKSGISPRELDATVADCLRFERINLVGLMAIPAPTNDAAEQRKIFRELREMRDHVQAGFGLEGFTQLSMGMSRDFEAAIREGSTWIRVGQGIFGPRVTGGKTYEHRVSGRR